MSKRLPYRATTASGNQFEFELPLHPDTGSAVNVANLLTAVLAALDHEARQMGSVSNGDVLQAVAMALAVRTRILPGQPDQLVELARGLLENALGAAMVAAPGNLPPDEPRGVH
jgi:hypothetical protein